MKKSLSKLIYRDYLTSSLITVLSVEVFLLVLYFGITTFITSKTMDTLLEEARYNLGEISYREGQKINQQLQEISIFAKFLQSEHQRFFNTPDIFTLPYGEPVFGVADNGVFYKKFNNGGSSLYYSSQTPIDDEAYQKARRTETFDPLFKEIVINNPNVVQVYFNTYDDMNRLYPFIDDVAKQFGPHINMEDFNFYYKADAKHNPERKPVWTDAYLDPAGQGWMVSCVVPVYNKNVLEAVSGIDITIEKIVDNILALELPWKGSAFLVNNKGMILAMPEEVEQYLSLTELKAHVYSDVLTSTEYKPEEFNLLKGKDKQIVAQIRNIFGGIKVMDFSLKNKEFLLSQHIIPETGWRLLFLVDKDVIFSPVFDLKAMVKKIGFAVIGLLIIFYSIFFLYLVSKSHKLSRKIAAPITNLANTTSEICNTEVSNVVPKHVNSSIEEVDQLDNNFNTMVIHLQNLFSNLEEVNNSLEIKVRERTHKLSETLEELQTTQQELVQSEKMAALGHLVAGIAHEINTPLGTIRASIENINNGLQSSVEQLPLVLKQLPEEKQQDFFSLIGQATETSKQLSTREERKTRKLLMTQLKQQQIIEAEDIAYMLINMGIYGDIEPYFALFKEPNILLILKAAHSLSRQKNNSSNIEQAINKASKIVFSLKSYAHVEQSSEREKTNIVENLEVVLTLYQNQLKQGIKVVKHYEEVPSIVGYPDELNQVWVNLIHNAIYAMGNQGILDIEVTQREPYVIVNITDSGHGIADEIKAHIFEPFFTTKARGEGSGLGLDIVKKVIEKHQGHIEFTSQPGHTTFSVFLPVKN